MGCKCGKGMRNTSRTVVSPPRTHIESGLATTRTPSELRQLAAAQNNNPQTPAGMDSARKETEAKRRLAIRKALGRG
jgi:hypothetical protein